MLYSEGGCGALPGGKAFYNLGCGFFCLLLLFWGCYLFVFIFLFCFRFVFMSFFLSLLKKCLQGLYSSLATLRGLLQAALWQGAVQVDGMSWAKTNTDCNIAIKMFQQN